MLVVQHPQYLGECEYMGQPDKVQAPTATAPGVVFPTMPLYLCHFLLSFGWFSLHPFYIPAQNQSKKSPNLQYGNPLKGKEGTLSQLQVK